MKAAIGLVLLAILLAFLVGFLQALAMWFIWTWLGIGATYFSFLPLPWHSPSFIDFWLLLALVSIMRASVTANMKEKA